MTTAFTLQHQACTLLLAALLAGSATTQTAKADRQPARPQASAKQTTIRGITISTHGIGRDWGRDEIVTCLQDLNQVGGNWGCTHPYARLHRNGRVRTPRFDPARPPEMIVRPIREAHRQGLKMMIKPHLAYWGSGFKWRGDIEFHTDEAWDRFFDSYQTWIVAVAAASKNADAFVVGTELDKTLRFVDRWRKIIAAVRKVTKAPLTYAANWTDYKKVKFWKDLDAIGIQAYFPVANKRGPTEQEITAGWAKRMDEVRTFSKEQGKHVVFTEIGYNRSHDAPVKPWEYHRDGPEAEPMQKMCLRIALSAIEREPRVLGSFLWKWFPQRNSPGRNFRLGTPQMKKVIANVWRPAAGN